MGCNGRSCGSPMGRRRIPPMKRIAVLGVLGLLALVVTAPAAAKHSPTYSPTPPPGSHKCVPHKVGYNAVGSLVDSALTAEENGRYSGTLEVNLTKANHHAPTGAQTFTLTSARVRFHNGVDPTSPDPGEQGEATREDHEAVQALSDGRLHADDHRQEGRYPPGQALADSSRITDLRERLSPGFGGEPSIWMSPALNGLIAARLSRDIGLPPRLYPRLPRQRSQRRESFAPH